MQNLSRMGLAFAAAALAASSALAAGNVSSADDRMLHDYVLTMPKVKAYEKATENLMAASKTDPSLKAEGDKASDEPDKTFADIKAKFAHHPRLYAFYARQGLSADDAILLPLSLMGACTVAQYPQIAAKMADSVSPAQIAFCKQNMATLKSMKFFNHGGEE